MSYDQFFKAAQKNAQKNAPQNASKAKAPSKANRPSAPTRGSKFALRDDSKTADAKKILARAADDTPERRLRAELALRLKAKQAAKRAKKPKPPLLAITVLSLSLVGCGVGYFFNDEATALIERLASKYDIGFFGLASAAEEKAADAASKTKPKAGAKTEGQEKTAAPNEKAEKSAETKGSGESAQAAPPTPNIKQWTPEELSFFTKLDERKKELDQREADLNKLDEELHKRETELEAKLKNLESMRGEISKTLKDRVALDQEKVEKLVQFYSTMKAPQAAKIIESLNEDLAVEVLDKMKKKNAAEIMDAMDAKKARRLSELLTGYERTPASAASADDGQ